MKLYKGWPILSPKPTVTMRRKRSMFGAAKGIKAGFVRDHRDRS